MQASTLFINVVSPFRNTTSKNSIMQRRLTKQKTTVHTPISVVSSSSDGLTVDYSSTISVFPAEACDTIGGEACNVDMFPEVKPVASAINTNQTVVSQEEVDRDYLDYSESKTVFPGEACDDLGGEFCEPEYQHGVFADK